VRKTVTTMIAIGVLIALTAAACSSDDDTDESGEPDDTDTTASSDTSAPGSSVPETTERPDGPAATIAGPMEGGNGTFIGAATPAGPALEAAGYTETEYTAAGTATSYMSEAELPADGNWALEPDATDDFMTRIVVRRPTDPAVFNGTVLVEWLNVSGGVDAGPDYTYLEGELLREGYVWVGVSAQLIGIEGGPVAVEAPGAEEAGAGKGLTVIDPERYGDLHHPGDAYSFDIYTQIARALRAPGDTDPLDGLDVQRLFAVGESQSAFTLTSYYNGVQPLTEAFDAFFIHSRGGAAAPIVTPTGYNDIASAIAGEPTQLRTDQAAPAFIIETEGDVLSVLGYYPARQPDSESIRVWEVAGAAHADLFQVGEAQEAAFECATPINRGQQVYVLRAALRNLQAWVIDGTEPPSAEPLEVDDSADPRVYVLDDVGNVVGGVRTPVVEAPVDVLSGLAPPGSSIICLLFGSTTPIPADELSGLYEGGDDYLEQYTAATDAGIEGGFLLEEDREAILAEADPARFDG
jgi:hypothetical protein